ncbi:hypothetical protein C8P66_11137 [Humitalea rosea]|uniref:Phytase-like domain-containing protein n=1 Tax=Humitalea rosea TaxID=990373 RepID=A0A2W7KDF4_9PROT|nr:esterase-like activity of phytase family protein [Humitalea rosea]PZW45622.1 hypothetical protein C8P66_11137 [Humitalea rosea]
MWAGRRALLAAALAGCGALDRPRGLTSRLPPFTTPPESPLVALGALEIHRDVLGLGGLSSLHVGDDLAVTAISDTGRWLRARLELAPDGTPLGLVEARTGPLRDGGGVALSRGYQGDAESLVRTPSGEWLVGFERWHRIRAYEQIDGPGRYVAPPPGLQAAPSNGGLESLTFLADGRLLAITENYWLMGQGVAAWLRGTDGAWVPTAYLPAPGMVPTDACGLPDGSVLVLERAFSLLGGFWGRLVRVPAAALAAPVIAGEAILALEPPLPTDNWEGVSAFTHRGRRLVALVSDDNESVLQRGLLMVLGWR